MEGNRRPFFKKHPDPPHFERQGGNKKGKFLNSSQEQSSEDSRSLDTVYRILCLSRKIGSVIGKGGSIVKTLREETQAKITVADSFPGSDERVIVIYSPAKNSRRQGNEEDSSIEKEDDPMEPHCAAQDALLKVHDRIVEEDIVGGTDDEDDNENTVTARLLVPNNMVGCLLGRKGDVIQKLRSETGASIRVLPADRLPTCAMSTDELVQISGRPVIVKRALFEVSTLLHQNPRKDKPPLTFPMPYGGQGFHPAGPPMADMLPPGSSLWSCHDSSFRGMASVPWMAEFEEQPFGYGSGDFDGVPSRHGGAEASSEFFMKILCPNGKIGGVIGKGGFNVKQLQHSTGASVHVEDESAGSEDRIIHVSSFEALSNPRSHTIEAILHLQAKTSELSEKGIITTRLLVPSSKVGCILGQGGNVINEMRRRTHADIRVCSKEDKPKCAADDEELLQISGNFAVAKDALGEISSRLRARFLRDANARWERVPIRPVQGFDSPGNLSPRRHLHPLPTRAGSFGGYELTKGDGHEYEASTYRGPPTAAGYPNRTSFVDMKIPHLAMDSVHGKGRGNLNEIVGMRVKLEDSQSGGSERIVEIRGPPGHLNASQSIPQTYYTTTAGQNNNPPQGSYQNMNTQHAPYSNLNTSQTPYQDMNGSQTPYQQYISTLQVPYHNISNQQAPYLNYSVQGSYQY